MSKFLFLILFFYSSFLYVFAQTPSDYLLVKANISSTNTGTLSWQWIATNNTSKSGNFYVLENVPAQLAIQSISSQTQLLTNPPINPLLPQAGPSTLTIGPFPIASNSSVTFNVNSTILGSSNNNIGESFILLSDTQLTEKNTQKLVANASLENPGTPSSDNSNQTGLIQSIVAAPNISTGNRPINFLINLNSPALVTLSLYNLVGERVFNTQSQEGQGTSTIVWNLQNNQGQTVSSGLYIYYLKVEGAGTTQTRLGKALIIR